MTPIIGITVDSVKDPSKPDGRGKLTLNWDYAQAIVDAGGLPILIPPMADMTALASMIDGWLIPGGDDIDACQFGEANHPKAQLQDPARYSGEEELLRALDPSVPVLGICYGCQFLNVVRGGTLIQHLPDVVDHESHAGGTMQRYSLKESKLRTAARTDAIEGKSYHHQAVRDLGANLTVVATAPDGTVEAIEATDRPWMIGVQWHPERTPEDEATRRLFGDFISAARGHAQKRLLAVAK